MESDCLMGVGFYVGLMWIFWYYMEGLAAQAVNVLHATDLFTLCGSFYVMGISPHWEKEKETREWSK